MHLCCKFSPRCSHHWLGVRDYKHIEELDNYEADGIDSNQYRQIGNRARERAEAEMRKRDRETMKNDSRVPAALRDDLGMCTLSSIVL